MSTILSAHQPAYLPWLGYFHKIAISDAFVILDEVQFEKNSFTNRNKIRTTHGAIWLTVPVLMTGHLKKTISQIEINNETPWRKKHWKSLYFNYKKAPYFDKYADFFEDFYKKDWIRLCDAAEYTLSFFIKELEIKTVFHKQSDLRVESTKQQLVLDLCKKLKSDTFVFGALGKNYADISMFKNNDVKAYFQNYKHPVYPQLQKNFISYLSIIDLLFNVGKARILDIIMSDNTSKKDLKTGILA